MIPKLTPYVHFRIGRFIGWLPRIKFIGKFLNVALVPILSLGHMTIVYQQTLAEGETEWKRRSAKTAIRK